VPRCGGHRRTASHGRSLCGYRGETLKDDQSGSDLPVSGEPSVGVRLRHRHRPGSGTPFCGCSAAQATTGPVDPGVVTAIRLFVVVATILAATWVVLIALVRALPPGATKDIATVLPACVTATRRLRRDRRVPLAAKLALVLAALWVLSPVDLVPEFLPVIGPLDDIAVVALALRFAARRTPYDVLMSAWPAEPRLLKRLVGPRRCG
jgi:uncharacterized membrane protein YkvA (DUF1232 family)